MERRRERKGVQEQGGPGVADRVANRLVERVGVPVLAQLKGTRLQMEGLGWRLRNEEIRLTPNGWKFDSLSNGSVERSKYSIFVLVFVGGVRRPSNKNVSFLCSARRPSKQ